MDPKEKLFEGKYNSLLADYRKLLHEYNLFKEMKKYMSVDDSLTDEEFEKFKEARKKYFRFKGWSGSEFN